MSRNTVISISGLEKKDEETWAPSPEVELEGNSQRPIFQRASYPPRLSLNGLLIGMLGVLLLVVMGFVPVPLPSILNIGTQAASYEQLSKLQYTFQIPLALFIGALLGPFMGTASVLLFLAVGLAFYPIFANGGGWHYIFQPGFGYLLGALCMAYLLGKTFHKSFQKQGNVSRSLKIFTSAFAAVLMLHAIGLVYMLALAIGGQLPWAELPGWALRLTVETAPYDMLSTAVFLCMVRQIRLALWLVLY